MKRRKWTWLPRVAAAMLVLAGATVPANARVSFSDTARDPGPLDIVKVKGETAGDYAVAVEITLAEAIQPGDLRPPNLLVVDVDHSGDGRGDHYFYIAPWQGRFAIYTWDVRERYTSCCSLSVRRTGPRTLRLKYGLFDHYDWFKGGHLFRVASYHEGSACPGGCFDVAPSRGWKVNDFTPPSISAFKVPIAAHSGAKPGVDLTYGLFDKGFSGLGKHDVLMRSPGDTAWKTLVSRFGGGRLKYHVDLDQGETAHFRLRARDRAGHSTMSQVRATTAPFDEDTPGMSTFVGLWETVDAAGSYLGTLHESRTPVDKFTFTETGTHYCLLHSMTPDYGTASMTVGETTIEVDMRAAVPLARQKTCISFAEEAERTVEVVPSDGVINVDGFWADTIYDPTARSGY